MRDLTSAVELLPEPDLSTLVFLDGVAGFASLWRLGGIGCEEVVSTTLCLCSVDGFRANLTGNCPRGPCRRNTCKDLVLVLGNSRVASKQLWLVTHKLARAQSVFPESCSSPL